MKKLFVAALLLFSLLFSLPAAAAEDAFTQLTHNGHADRTGRLHQEFRRPGAGLL